MRGNVPGLPSPHPIGLRLPALYHENEFVQRFTTGLDDLLAPALVSLDSFYAYLDPRLAPPDFVRWLARWVALTMDEDWTDEQTRRFVAEAVRLHRWRGTRYGLAAHLRLVTDGEVTIEDSGAAAWSERPGAAMPGTAPAEVTVQITVKDATTVDAARLKAIVAEAAPAHVRVTVRVTDGGQRGTVYGRV